MSGSGFMITGLPLLFSLLPLLTIAMGLASHAQTSTQKIYDFKVFLDDDEIGVQRFVVL